MFGMIGAIKAQAHKRNELVAILADSVQGLPGCLGYVIAEDANDPDCLWITEVWDSEESHKASLSKAEVQTAISKARPLIAEIRPVARTKPILGIDGSGVESA